MIDLVNLDVREAAPLRCEGGVPLPLYPGGWMPVHSRQPQGVIPASSLYKGIKEKRGRGQLRAGLPLRPSVFKQGHRARTSAQLPWKR